MSTPGPSRRKIAWLSPFGPMSDVGAHSAALVRALHRLAPDFDCDLALFVEPNGSTYATDAPSVTMGPHFPAQMLSLFDAVALNLGNNQENHGRINELALTRGGIVIVHDIIMQAYLARKLFGELKRPGRYADLMVRWYGARAIDFLDRLNATLKDGEPDPYFLASAATLSFPLIEPFLQKAQAIVVHSRFAGEIVAAISGAPQLSLFLPSDKKPAP